MNTMTPTKAATSKKVIALKAAVFLLIFALLFGLCTQVLIRKSLTGAWNTTIKIGGFPNEPEDSIDVIGFGSSHMYSTISPLELYHQSGISGYIYSVQQQPIWGSYYYMIEALKYQSPDLVVLEVYTSTYTEAYTSEPINYSTTDPLPLSLNKLDLIDTMVPEEERWNHMISLIPYHTRWKELTRDDLNFTYFDETDLTRGYVLLEETSPVVLNRTEGALTVDLFEKNVEYLDKIVALSLEYDFDLLFLAAPCVLDETQQSYLKAMEVYAADRGIPYLNYNSDAYYNLLQLDENTDFYDNGHLNFLGAEKTTIHFASYLQEHYNLTDHRGDESFDHWDTDYVTHRDYIAQLMG